MLDSLILRHHDRQAALVQKASNQSVGTPFNDLNDGALGLASILTGLLDEHAVAVQHLEHFTGG